MPEKTGEGLQTKVDNVLDLGKDEKLKVQLEIRKLASELKKEVTNTDKKKTDAIAKMDQNFDKLIHTGIVEKTTLDQIKNETLTDYVDATLIKPKSATGSSPINWSVAEEDATVTPVIDQTIDDTNKLKIKETTVAADGSLTSTQDTPDGSAGRLKAVKDRAIEDKKIDLDKTIEASLTTIDGLAEAEYLQWKPNQKMTQAEADIAFTGFASNVAKEIDNQLLTAQEQAVMGYRFQVLNLEHIIKEGEQQNKSNEQSESGNSKNPNQRPDISNIRPIYLDRWETKDVTTDGTANFKPTEDIYKKNHMHEAMKELLRKSNNTIDKLSNGTFGVNLSKENGFAGIIALLSKNGLSEETPCAIGKYNFMIENHKIKVSDGTEAPRDLKWQDLDSMKKSGLISYEHEIGVFQWDNEFSKMTKIMNAANWTDLQDFADISGVRDAQYSAIKETVNAKNSLLLDKTSVFKFLCDRNGDGVLSADGKRNKEQKNLGDIGNIFGQQLNFTIEQAMKVQNVLYGDEATTYNGKGERIVIQNIMRTIMIQNPRVGQSDIDYNKLEKCTRENLVASIRTNPKFKTYFTAAIEKINGSSSVLTPDLYDTLTGNTMNTILKSQDWEMRTTIESDIDRSLIALKKNEKNKKPSERNQDLIDYLEKHTTIELRENLASQIMNIADGFTLVGSDTQAGYLRNPGISKEFVDKEAKNKFINDLTQQAINAIAVGAFSPENGIRIPVNFIKTRRSQEGRTLASVHAGVGAGYNWLNNGIILTLGLGGDVAEQYNYNKVINAKLDDVKTAKYLGAEAQVMAGTDLKQGNIGVEGSAGIEWQQNRITGINQINRQYESVSRRIFSGLSATDISSYENIEKAFARNISDVKRGGPLSEFVKTNENRLEENARFIVSFLKENQAIESISNKKPGAINELISIIQMGNIEQWRSDLLNNVNGKFDISKLSFGVTTNALTVGFKNSDSYTKAGSDNTRTSSSTDVNGGGTETVGDKEYKFGLAGFYVGMRISNWQTKYHVNENQLVNTRRKVAEGTNVEDISMKNPEIYAKYLSAVFNKEGSTGLEITALNGKITIINHTNPKIDLPHLLNIRVTDDAKKEIVYNTTNDSLIIGNVGDISASTVARADGVERRLCIGSKKYSEGKIINIFDTEKDKEKIHPYTMKESGKYETTTQTDITNLVSEKKNTTGEVVTASPFAKNPKAQEKFMDCFENGQLKKTLPNGVILQSRENKIGAGKLVVFKQDGDNYTMSIEKNTDASKLSLRFIDKDNYVNGEKLTFTKIDGSETKIDTFATKELKIKEAFKNFDVKKYGVLDSAFNKKTKKLGSKQEFLDFMNATDLAGQRTNLLKLLPADDATKPIIDALNNNKDTETQNYIVDQFRGIFAYQVSYETHTMNTFWEERSPKNKKGLRTFPFLNALNITDSNLKNEVLKTRNDMLMLQKGKGEKTTENYDSKKWEVIPNLIGFTAFYKHGVIPQGSLVSAGDTKVMPVRGKLYTEISKENKNVAKKWIADKLNEKTSDNKGKYDEQKEILLDGIKKNIKDVSLYPEITNHFSELIEKGEVILDKSLKKVILKSRPVVYFKAECINESVGLIIDGLEIQETPVQDVNVSKEYLVASGQQLSVAATPTTTEKSINGKYYGEVSAGDGSYTKATSDNKGTTKDTDVNGTKNNDR